MMLIFMLSFALPVILILINSLIAKKLLADREKPSPFECGFDPKSSARLPFSLRFYLIALVFLIFDVEITVILPIPMITHSMNSMNLAAVSMFFIFILIAGLFHEWNEGALHWDL